MKLLSIIQLAVLLFFGSCTKVSNVEQANLEERFQTAASKKSAINEMRLPLSTTTGNNNALPPSKITFSNRTFPSQTASVELINVLTPNSPVFSLHKREFFDLRIAIINCPKPRPPRHPFCPLCEGSTPMPGCPIMDEIYKEIYFDFRLSRGAIFFEVFFNDQTPIISRELTKTNASQYQSAGDIGLSITAKELQDYNKSPNKASAAPIVAKFFGFFDIKLITSN